MAGCLTQQQCISKKSRLSSSPTSTTMSPMHYPKKSTPTSIYLKSCLNNNAHHRNNACPLSVTIAAARITRSSPYLYHHHHRSGRIEFPQLNLPRYFSTKHSFLMQQQQQQQQDVTFSSRDESKTQYQDADDTDSPYNEMHKQIRFLKDDAREAFQMGDLQKSADIYTRAIQHIKRFNLEQEDSAPLEEEPQQSLSPSEEAQHLFSKNTTPQSLTHTKGNEFAHDLAILHGNRSLINLKMDRLKLALKDAKLSAQFGLWKGHYRAAVALQKMGQYQEALDEIKNVFKFFSEELTQEQQDEVRQLEAQLEKETDMRQTINIGNEPDVMMKFEKAVQDMEQGLEVSEKLFAQFVYFFSKRQQHGYVKRIFNFLKEKKMPVDVRVYTSILQSLISSLNGSTESIEREKTLNDIKELLDEMERQSVPLNDVGYLSLLRYVVRQCSEEESELHSLFTTRGILDSMKETGHDTLSYVEVLAFLDCEKTITSPVMKEAIGKMSSPADARLFTSFVRQVKDIEIAIDIHNFMLKDYGVDYNIQFYNALLGRLSKNKDTRTLGIYKAMRNKYLLPDAVTYRILLLDARRFRNSALYDSLIQEMEKRNISLDDVKMTFHRSTPQSERLQRSNRRQLTKPRQSYDVKHTDKVTDIQKKVSGYEDARQRRPRKWDQTSQGQYGHRF